MSASPSRNGEFSQDGEVRMLIGDQWFYRGNRSNVWLAVASQSGISDRVPSICWPFLEEIARLRFTQSESVQTMSAQGLPLRFYGASGISGCLAGVLFHVDNGIPDDVIELRDGERVIGRIINVGR